VFVVSSPSGGGKTTVVNVLLSRVPKLVRSVSVTTRERRPEERAGRDYQFISTAKFDGMRAGGRLLEWAQVHQAFYGTPRASVERAIAGGRDVILSIDVQGAEQVRRQFGTTAVLVFLLPPSMRDLRARLVRRRTETAESLRHRLQAAERELACAQWYDYGVVNRDLNLAVEQLEAIIIAERLRVASHQQGG
jgi:guanylate kinase